MIKPLLLVLAFLFISSDLLALTKIAILPYEQLNLQNPFLTKSINDLLVSRLSKPNEIEVTEVKNISSRENLPKIGEILKNNRIDYFIKGKITQSSKVTHVELYLFNTKTLQPETHLKFNSEKLDGLINEINEFSLDVINRVRHEKKAASQPKIEIREIPSEPSERPVLLSIPDSETDLTHRVHPDKLFASKELTSKKNQEKTPLRDKLKLKIDAPKERPELLQVETEKRDFRSENVTGVNPEFFTEKERLIANLQVSEGPQNTFQRPILTLEKDASKKDQPKTTTKKAERSSLKRESYSDLPYPSPYDLKPIGKGEVTPNEKPLIGVTPKETPTSPAQRPILNPPRNITTP